jgi:surface protein
MSRTARIKHKIKKYSKKGGVIPWLFGKPQEEKQLPPNPPPPPLHPTEESQLLETPPQLPERFKPMTKEELKSAIRETPQVRMDKGRGDINTWDISSVHSLSYLFHNNKQFNENISNWNVSGVTDMSGMFEGASSFNGNISTWDVSNVTYMFGMFKNATSFNQDLEWNVSGVMDMSGMFEGASLFNRNISTWNVSIVTDMSAMFKNATSFNQDLDWNVSNVTNMSNMFEGASSFNGNISTWDVSSVTDMFAMFEEASSFNQDLSAWGDKLGNVKNMAHMFYDASSFHQSLANWNVPQLEHFGGSNSEITELFNIPDTLETLMVKNCNLTTFELPPHPLTFDVVGNPLPLKTLKKLVDYCLQYGDDYNPELRDEYDVRKLERVMAFKVGHRNKLPSEVNAAISSNLGGRRTSRRFYRRKSKYSKKRL